MENIPEVITYRQWGVDAVGPVNIESRLLMARTDIREAEKGTLIDLTTIVG